MSELMNRYRRSMRRRELAPGTITKRTGELRAWIAYIGPAWPTATRRDVETWIDGRPLGARARYAAVSHLHQFYRWAQREEYCTGDPTEHVERPRLARGLPRPGRLDVVDRTIAEAPPAMGLILALMADAGLRCCEVSRLEWSDVDLEAGTLHLVGKGGHHRVVGIPARLRLHLYANDAGAGPVLGRPVRPARVSHIVGAYLRSVGVPLTAHQFRHTYATRLYRATGGDLLAVQHALGHASVTSTQIYAAADPGRAVDVARLLD